MSRVKYKPNKHQIDFHNDITSKKLHLSSGFGGGKTHALIMKMFKLSQLNKGINGGLMCPTYSDFIKDVKPLIEEICYQNSITFTYQGQEHWYQFPWSTGKVYIVSAKHKIRGPNWGFALINELTLCPLVRYKEIMGRVRVKRSKCPQIASVGTPEGMDSEYYDYMIENPKANFRIIYGDTRDNQQNLTDDYVQDLMDSYDSAMQDAYVRGLWVNMTGNKFYYSYSEKNENNKIIKVPYSTVHVSMDFNVDPMVANCWNFDGKKLKAFDEITIKGLEGGAKTKNMCDALKARGYTPDDVIIYPDPAGRARSTKGEPDHEILKTEGFINIRSRKRAPLMRQRQLHMNNLLEKITIEINPKTCPELRKDFLSVSQDVVTLDKDKSNANRTHHSDGADYLCDILIPFKGKTARSTMERIR